MATRYLCPVFLAIAFWLPGAQAAVVPNVAGQTQADAVVGSIDDTLVAGFDVGRLGALDHLKFRGNAVNGELFGPWTMD